MIRNASLLLAGTIIGAAAAVTLSQVPGLVPSAAHAAVSDTYRQLNLFGDVFERVRADYVEKPDDSALIEAAVNGMLTSLDPHSSYMNAKDFKDMQVQTRGEFGGLGIEVTMEDGVVKVVSPIDDTPAAKAGILAGDLIIAIDGDPVQNMNLNQAVEKMRGAVNTPITLQIQRKGTAKPFDVKIVRDVIRIQSVKSRAEGDIGYIRISSFNEQTFDGLKARDRQAQRRDRQGQDQGLYPRSAQQSGRPARSGGRGRRRLPGSGRDRRDARPAFRPEHAL